MKRNIGKVEVPKSAFKNYIFVPRIKWKNEGEREVC